MAHIIPADISRLALSRGNSAELRTLDTLTKFLPSDYTIFHNIYWSREYKSGTSFGEIDFIIMNRSAELLLIEQKSGALRIENGRLVKAYGDEDKDVVNQVHRASDLVREKFKWQHGKSRRLTLDYLLYCPDDRVVELNAAGLDRSRVVDATSAADLPARVQALLSPGIDRDDGWYRTVHDFFCQTFRVVPDIHAHVAAGERAYVRLVGPVTDVLGALEMTPYRLRMTGVAGSGKSLLARSFFESRAKQGKRVLFTCFNRPLAERQRAAVGALGEVNTWYGFLHRFLESRGITLDFEQSGPEFWRRVQERAIAETVPDNWLFDAVVLDEAQDFEGEWFEVLRLFLREDADVLLLEDPDQNLQGYAPVSLSGFVGYRCRTNYRSPLSIARFIRDTMPFDFEPGCALPGLGVGVHGYDEPAEQRALVGHIIRERLREGFAHEDIVVLTCRGVQSSVLSDPDVAASLGLRQFTGDYSTEGEQLMTAGRITFDSVRRFKGQEAPAVILADVDPRADKLAADERLVYCGMTRATVRLDMLVANGNAENKRFGADRDDRGSHPHR